MNPGFFAFFQTQPTVVALIADRIYAGGVPQHLFEEDRVMPCVAWRRLGIDQGVSFCGSDTLVSGTFEFVSYAPDYDGATDIADALSKVLVDYRGLMGTVPVGPVLKNSDADREPDPLPGLYGVSQVFTVWYTEP